MIFVQTWQTKTEYDVATFTDWLGISRSKYYSWVGRQGQENQPNGVQSKHHWLTEDEKTTIINYYTAHRQTGYRRLAYMMLDEDVAAVSPSSVYRVLSAYGLLRATTAQPTKKGTGFQQPKRPHQHWHIDIILRQAQDRLCINTMGWADYVSGKNVSSTSFNTNSYNGWLILKPAIILKSSIKDLTIGMRF